MLDTVSRGVDEFATFKRTQVQLFLSNAVLAADAQRNGDREACVVKEHYDDPVAWLKGKLIIDYPDDSEILRVAIKTKKSSDSIKIVNIVVEKYQSEIVATIVTSDMVTSKKLSDTYGLYLADCKKQEESLFKMQLINKTPSTRGRANQDAIGG